MADNKTYDAKPNGLKPNVDKSLVPQRQVLAQTGKIKTPAEAGAGKPSTKYPW